MANETLIITQDEIKQALDLNDYISIIEQTHACHAKGQVYTPDLLHADVHQGEFHLKTGGLIYPDGEYYGVKINGGFLNNTRNYQLPNILGIIYICDAKNGYPLAVMDSVTISKLRTGAASAVAAKYLASQQPIQLGVFGYGSQAEIQTKAISKVRQLEHIRISGRNMEKATAFAAQLQKEFDIPVTCHSLEETARSSNLIITATPARGYYLKKEWINPGTFIAAVGADSPGKQELQPELVASATIVADIKSQVCRVGESQHALKQGLITPENIYAELGEIVTGQKALPSTNGITIYDSTGTALQDISIGVTIYKKLKQTECTKIKLFY